MTNAHVRRFCSGLADFRLTSYGKIVLMSNISKTVTDTTTGPMEAEYETSPRLSVGTMIFILDDLELH